MKIAVIYDFGVNNDCGYFVMLNILEPLDNAGCEFSPLTSYPEELHESAKFLDSHTPDTEVRHFKVPKFLKHPTV